MAYLVIAVGLLMSLAGGTLLNYGYAIVQVERGWSSVIAGSVFLTGGVVTMGLGLLLRALAAMGRDRPEHTELAGRAAESRADLDPAVAFPAAAEAGIPSFATSEVDFAPSHLMAADVLAVTLPLEATPVVAATREDDRYGKRAPAPVGHGEEHAAQEYATQDYAAQDYAAQGHATQGHVTQEHVTQEHAGEGHAAEHATGVEPPGEPAFHADDVRPPGAEAPAMDDWLDRAFSEIDGASPTRAVAGTRSAESFGIVESGVRVPHDVLPPRIESIHAEPAHTQSAERVLPQPSDVEPASVAPPPLPPPHDSPVIGRYESDETSYIMYADGSIEAQSPAGVYRFSSMAELKAFIEG